MKLIAETAWHHDGDVLFFKELVETIVNKTNTDYIKFHITLDVDEYIHTDHAAYNWVKEHLLTEKQWDEILTIAINKGNKLMLLFNDCKAIDFGMQYNPEIVEIHSVCLNDINLLNHLTKRVSSNTKIVLGVGGSDLYDIESAINTINSNNLVLMHGFQNYPTKYEDINLQKIKRIMQLFPNALHGYADHTAWDNENNALITLLGAALGMQYIEKHVTIKPGEVRTDWQAAITVDMFNELSNKLEVLEQAKGDGLLKLNDGEKSYSTYGANKKAAILSKPVTAGEILTADSFTFKRTGQSSDLSQTEILSKLGQKFTKNQAQGHCIIKSDLK
jgi:N,N'-diacetyllegionaminate synthase